MSPLWVCTGCKRTFHTARHRIPVCECGEGEIVRYIQAPAKKREKAWGMCNQCGAPAYWGRRHGSAVRVCLECDWWDADMLEEV